MMRTLWLCLSYLVAVPQAAAFSSPALLSRAPAAVVGDRGQRTALHVHEFWSTARSKAEVKAYVEACLDQVPQCDLVSRVNVISAEPPLVVIHDFLSQSMCRDIIDAAVDNPDMKRSTTGEQNDKSDSRTSSTVWLREGNDDDCNAALRLTAEKVSSVTGLPPSHMENLQVCRYLPGQEFKLHTDHQNSFNEIDCRGRLATCLLYLAEPEAGGETWFPSLADNDDESETKIAPTNGSAVFFWNTVEKPGSSGYDPYMFLNADMRLLHAGLPVVQGEKWICNRWVHPVDFGAGVRGTAEPLYDKESEPSKKQALV